MLLDQETLRFIFGMKLRNLRQEKGFSLHVLAKAADLSPSYINEIEKGKKYPKTDKILTLARALGVEYDDLISVKLSTELAHLAKMFEKGPLKAIPFHIFGIPAQALMEVMADAPHKFSALVGTLLEIVRLYDIRVEEVFVACLKAYIDMHGNYFPDIEAKVLECRKQLKWATPKKKGGSEVKVRALEMADSITKELEKSWSYRISTRSFRGLGPEVGHLLFFYIPGKSPQLILSESLSERERVFVLGKALGYEVLGLKERFSSSFTAAPDSFDKLLHNFQASYFSGALLLEEGKFSTDLQQLFSSSTWLQRDWEEWLSGMPAPYVAVMHRLAQVVPKLLGIERLFLLEMEHARGSSEFSLSKQLHLADLHSPHRVSTNEKYCRRWITVRMLADIGRGKFDRPQVGVQRSRFVTSDTEYLCLAASYPKEGNNQVRQCVTLGLQISGTLRRGIKFLEDEEIPMREVGDTCESCPRENCHERAAPAENIDRRSREEHLQGKIAELIAQWSA